MAEEQREPKATESDAFLGNEDELRTMIADVWHYAVDPHQLDKGLVKEEEDLDEGMTIVAAAAVPQGALMAAEAQRLKKKDGKPAAGGQPSEADPPSTAPKTPPSTISILLKNPIETKEPAPESGSNLAPDNDDTETDMAMVTRAAQRSGEKHPSDTSVVTASRAGPETVSDVDVTRLPGRKVVPGAGSKNVPNLGTSFGLAAGSMMHSGFSSSMPIKRATAGVLVKAAKGMHADALTRMVIQEKVVVDAEATKDVQELNRILPDYEILKVLGEGGMGLVYQARQTSIDREIALKVIKPDMAHDQSVQTVFLAEAAITGELEHPNIVPIYELGVHENGQLFYAMKQTKGSEWRKVFKKKTVEENIEILLRAADAVAFAHSKGIIHRDLKPGNFMLGEFGEVLVMDWGMAVSVKSGGKIGMATRSNVAGGTPAYMAPEMVLGKVELLGTHCDIYLLGAILFEILTGKCPHRPKGNKMMDLLYNIAKNKIQETDQKGELIDIAYKAMATDPQDRFQTVKEFQAAVTSALKHTESIRLAEKTQGLLDAAVNDKEYEGFAQALFGFQEALAMWDGNVQAEQGVEQAREAYAQAALEKEDLDLAGSLINNIKNAPAELVDDLSRRIEARKAKEIRFKTLKYTAAALVAIIVLGLTASYVLVEGKRIEAVKAREEAETERGKALKAKDEAERQRVAAEKAKAKEQQQRIVAEKAKATEQQQRIVAENATKKEQQQRILAEDAKAKEQQQRIEAENAKANEQRQRIEAENAKANEQQQRILAEEAKKEAVKKREEAEKAKQEAERQRTLAEKRLKQLQSIGELKARIDRSLKPEEAKALQAKAAQAEHLDMVKVFNVGQASLELVLLPPGGFVMGSDVLEKNRTGEEYLHAVEITKPFYMGRNEVTEAQWLQVVGKANKKDYVPAADAGLPVVNVSYNQITEEFLPKLQAFAPKGFVFRLPTEAEWEYACRAGCYERYHDAQDALDDLAWYENNSEKKLHAVGGKKANAWGLLDMHGNAAEICRDYYEPNFYLSSKQKDPVNDKPTPYRVSRGGSWINLAQHCRAAYRSNVHPKNKHNFIGFRVVLASR